MSATQINFHTAPGHQVLAAAGKQILRPGGRRATEQLFNWANFKRGETLLELAASFGTSAIALAQQYGLRVVGIEKNPESVDQARKNILKAGLSQQVEIIEGDILQLDQVAEQFDYVLAEAILTMQSPPAKAKILSGIAACLKPRGQFLSHELLVSGPDVDAIRRDLSGTIRVNANPLTSEGWIETCQQAGLDVQHHHSGPMVLLQPHRIAQEEGINTVIAIAWNMATRPILRKRILSMREAFNRHSHNLGHMILCAQKGDT